MSDADIPSEALALLERIASVLRAELGVEIDAYPGPHTRAGRPTQPCVSHRRP